MLKISVNFGMNPHVDTFLIDGCGRCSYYKTPQCKVITWNEELKVLRSIALESGLKEDLKWSQPCYTYHDKNVFIVSAFKDYAVISFFKGSLLKDDAQLLHAPGKNSQASRQFRFTSVQQIEEIEKEIRSYIAEAIEIEKKGAKVEFNKELEPIPDELLTKFNEDPYFESAFYALTPGRQRGYILYFSQPKQSKTRMGRIEKYTDHIFKGEGIHDGYKKRNKG